MKKIKLGNIFVVLDESYSSLGTELGTLLFKYFLLMLFIHNKFFLNKSETVSDTVSLLIVLLSLFFLIVIYLIGSSFSFNIYSDYDVTDQTNKCLLIKSFNDK